MPAASRAAAPVPSEPGDLLARVRALELAARANATGHLAGAYPSSLLGRGMLFHEARKYSPGESARRIDWNITARVAEPYVRLDQEERLRDVWVALDVSPSMRSGLGASRTKLEWAVEAAATLAVAALDAGDRIGLVTFADRVRAEHPPRGGRRQLFTVLRALLDEAAGEAGPRAARPKIAESDPRAAIRAIERRRGRRFMIFLVSDFVDHDVPEDLKYLRPRHDAALLHVHDPLEYGGGQDSGGSDPVPARLDLAAAEGPGAPALLAPGSLESFAAADGALRAAAARMAIAAASFATDRPVGLALGRFFHGWRRRR